MENEKQIYRQIKREKKRAGNKNVRNSLKRDLRDHPNEAHMYEYDYGRHSTKEMNGKFLDSKRKEKDAEKQ